MFILRPPLWQRVMPTVALLALSLISAGAGADRGGWLWPVSFALATVGLVGVGRSLALRIEARPEELVLVNWFHTVHLPWAQVARCGFDTDGLWVRRDDGREVRASCFQHGRVAFDFARVPAKTAAARLEQIRKQRRQRR
ncbi:PH domain-containing protein [Actinoplanes sp. KI2]|uniref:PH domain-containing protein n=1 Tax=Actinoplanes sp. KI2 TaxID=2983315 RepID=UPI0021D5A299|nr:PH domain-containing protein [Actinoplanes sp. KI2]MCU7728373.1 PH domain-containing protein [Actinoplanes sp. KI2]